MTVIRLTLAFALTNPRKIRYSGKVAERAAVITFLESGLTNPRGVLDPDVAQAVETIKNRYLKAS